EQDICIVAAGPLASPKLTQTIGRITGSEQLYFYDAVAPIISLDSIAMEHTFWGSRYDKGEARSYLNCILTKEEYFNLWTEMVRAEQHPLEAFEEMHLFEGCMPIEELARRGPDTMRYGPLKPVGLKDPKTGKQPYAAVQLRQDNQEGTLYNMVGFQTRLKWNEQARVFGLIPALKEAEFIRYGVMHRNTFVNSPRVLKPTWQLKEFPTVFFAGQITGVEGYVESATSGLIAGVNAARLAANLDPLIMPTQTACGALANYITTANPSHFQPMNINFGLFPPLENRIRNRRQRNLRFVHRALEALENYWQHLEL
ncbi:MAG TPA: FADH(2)-oxidizing methylenetetrahydrofolate--tRNA-(uracil(54)-C(5))-methyltransferase TrmFO, partial [bacterium]|nr:FADH(2)-oxidizing methylenetetrahydrofolate--tRNA-(uracil(54)-C(5))-methyltransferase TrmFO [bacterium]